LVGEPFITSGAKKCFEQTVIRCSVCWVWVDRVVKDGTNKAAIIRCRPVEVGLY